MLQSVRLGPGDEVLLTDHAYGAVALAARRQCRRAGATARTVAVPLGAPDSEVVSRLRNALRPGRTKLLIVDQLTSATAKVLPGTRHRRRRPRARHPGAGGRRARARACCPVDVSAIGADFWVGNLHKWAFAPRGTALLAVAPAWRRRIDPLVVSWQHDQGFPSSVEFQGTLDYTPWLAAPAGLFVLRTLGVDAVRAHNAALAAYGQRVVGEALGVAADLPDPGDPSVSMRIVPLPAGLATTVSGGARPAAARSPTSWPSEIAINAWGGRGWLRLSAQVYNRPDEYDRLAERLPAADCTRWRAVTAGPGRGRARPAGPDRRRRAAVPSAGRPPPGSRDARPRACRAPAPRSPGHPIRARRLDRLVRWSAGRRDGPRSTTPRPATRPANTTVPGTGATGPAQPGGAARSTPRCPASQGSGGGSKAAARHAAEKPAAVGRTTGGRTEGAGQAAEGTSRDSRKGMPGSLPETRTGPRTPVDNPGQPPKPASSGSEMSGFSSSSTLTSLNVITRTFFTNRAGRYMSQTQASCISTSK